MGPEVRYLRRELCPRCGREQPTPEEWVNKPDGWGPNLCWHQGGILCEDRRDDEHARLRMLAKQLELSMRAVGYKVILPGEDDAGAE